MKKDRPSPEGSKLNRGGRAERSGFDDFSELKGGHDPFAPHGGSTRFSSDADTERFEPEDNSETFSFRTRSRFSSDPRNSRRGEQPPKKTAASGSGGYPSDAEKADKRGSGFFYSRRREARTPADRLDTSSVTEARGISHEAHRRRQVRREFLKLALAIGSVLLVFVLAVIGYRLTTVKTIRITGSTAYSEAQLLSMSGIRTGRNILFYNESALKSDLNAIHDIRAVSVKKVLPSSIEIVVTDISPCAAILSPAGTYTFISDDGYVLSIGEASLGNLIEVRGMTGYGFAVNTYINKQNSTIRTVTTVALLEAIEKSAIAGKVRYIDLTNAACVKLGLDGDYEIVVGTLSEAAECVDTAAAAYFRFLPVYPSGGTIQVFHGSTVVDFTPRR